MVDATCLNDDCDRETWELTKHPTEYARGVTCPDCGTTQVDYDVDDEPDQPRGREAAPPTRREPVGGGAGLPARQQGQLPEAVERGAEGGNALFEIVNADSRGDMLQGFGAALLQLGDRENERAVREREAAAGVSEVQRSEQYPQCPDCGHSIERKPVGRDEFPCPNCGTPLEVV